MLRQPYIHKILLLFHAIVCHFSFNDTGGRREEKMRKCDIEKKMPFREWHTSWMTPFKLKKVHSQRPLKQLKNLILLTNIYQTILSLNNIKRMRPQLYSTYFGNHITNTQLSIPYSTFMFQHVLLNHPDLLYRQELY